jgi:plasmid stabilization system protein ParE
MRVITISDTAADDLSVIRSWLRQAGAGPVAAKRLDHIRKAIRELRLAPCRWPLGEHDGIRERIVEGYAILYEVDPDTGTDASAGDVTILRVFGPGQRRSRV